MALFLTSSEFCFYSTYLFDSVCRITKRAVVSTTSSLKRNISLSLGVPDSESVTPSYHRGLICGRKANRKKGPSGKIRLGRHPDILDPNAISTVGRLKS
ncbi:hypothetical protein PILCRDRAFT_9529 [Piloderma croceum F 1598]|uniref:Uncharacterized protein n=1 Tax=Piloderma croceum (strain F 1598) TaxID=765440 RepID=A0A0C3FLF6_PILCF|nr:hypothetical protein PILCRDRAFT_9529 [Piloderma croceum F 1598]